MTDRTTELRRALVATADAAPYSRPRRRGVLVAAGIAAFALAGSVTGFAAATASTGSTFDEATARWVLSFARANSQLLGEIIHNDKTGPIDIDLGAAPEGATGFVLVATCTSVGRLDMTIDGVWAGGADCTDEGTSLGDGVAWTQTVAGGGTHTLVIDTRAGMVHEEWVAWVKEPPLPAQSRQQQAELRDGVVTRAEYLAAYNRYLGCMAAGGYDVGGIEQRDQDVTFSLGIPSAAHDDGTDEICYVREFKDVDSAWQLLQE